MSFIYFLYDIDHILQRHIPVLGVYRIKGQSNSLTYLIPHFKISFIVQQEDYSV